MKPEIQERFQDALKYDQVIGKIFPGYDLLPEVILSALRTKLGEEATLLDVGCGTGNWLLACAAKQPGWSLVGVDPTGSMVGLAQTKFEELSDAKLSLHESPIEDFQSASSPFQAATMNLVEHLKPDDGTKLRILQSIADRLEPGGWYVHTGLHGDLQEEGKQTLDAWVQSLQMAGFPPQAQEAFVHKATVEDAIAPESRLRALFAEAGFEKPEKIFHVQLLGGWLMRKAS